MATIRGDAGNNRLSGTNSPDGIYGFGGDDLLFGRGSADRLLGGTGRDRLYGGTGDDRLKGGAGNDLLHGGAGSDRLDGGAGVDTANYSDETVGLFANLFTGAVVTAHGIDQLSSIERFYGGAAGDVITGAGEEGEVGANVEPGRGLALFGFGGDDFVFGGIGNDYLQGNEGDDGLSGDAGHDRLLGGDGDDLLLGGDGNDILQGGAGDDLLEGDAGDDRLDGGDGIDTVDYSDGREMLVADLFAGEVFDGDGKDQLVSIERFYGSRAGDVITATAVTGDDAGPANVVLGQGLEIFGLGGNDFIGGSAGNDLIEGGAGNDNLSGSAGDDRILGGEGDDILFGDAGTDLLTGGAGNDRFDMLVEIPEDPSELSFISGHTIALDFTRGEDKLYAAVSEGDPSARLDSYEVFARLDSNHDGSLTEADDWVELRDVQPDGMAARGSLVIDFGNAVAPDLVGSGHTLTLYGVTSVTKSDFVLDSGPVLAP
ncbi:calcium-binding protein [Geminicoccus harenae]|uniref:calcium-binding protein n=1 Tax=Geminicoccus harenae TaxID=2498453 RepID=UPI00168AA75B|nr:calcium-binding protein [Geminicoccus harenae]